MDSVYHAEQLRTSMKKPEVVISRPVDISTILLMEEILHQLIDRLSGYPIIYKVL